MVVGQHDCKQHYLFITLSVAKKLFNMINYPS